MAEYLAERALLPDGIAADVRLSIDAAGMLRAVTPDALADAPADGATRLRGVVVPGLPNLHGHAFQRAMAGLAECRESAEDSFWSWRRTMYALVQQLTPEQVEAIAAQAYVEMLQAGYTHAVEFHYLHNRPDGGAYADPLELAHRVRAAQATSGIGLTLLPTLYRFGGFGEAAPEAAQGRFLTPPDAFVDRLSDLVDATAGTQTVRIGAALHSLRAVAPADLRAIPAAAHTIDPEMPIHIHVAEQTREVAACQAAHGTTPVAFLLDHAAVDGRWCLIHATHMDQAETARLAATGAVAGLCPTTEANLGDGVFPLELYLGRGGRLGVGSDSHVSLDPRDELRLLEDTRRLLSQQRNRVATAASPHVGAHLYDLALHGGAQAAGAPVGRLAPGHRADLVVLDRDHPSLAACPDAHLLDAWLLTRHGSPVRAVAVAGDWVVRDGRHRAAEPVAGAYRAAVRSLAF